MPPRTIPWERYYVRRSPTVNTKTFGAAREKWRAWYAAYMVGSVPGEELLWLPTARHFAPNSALLSVRLGI
jgi:hypothetical protein